MCEASKITKPKITRRLLEKFSNNFGPPSLPFAPYNLWWKVAEKRKTKSGACAVCSTGGRTKSPNRGSEIWAAKLFSHVANVFYRRLLRACRKSPFSVLLHGAKNIGTYSCLNFDYLIRMRWAAGRLAMPLYRHSSHSLSLTFLTLLSYKCCMRVGRCQRRATLDPAAHMARRRSAKLMYRPWW